MPTYQPSMGICMRMNEPDERNSATPKLVEHFFRHEYGRLVAVLTRRFGPARLDVIEDAVQRAFERALGVWPRSGVPEKPAAWLTRVATNALIDRLRQREPSDACEHEISDACEDHPGESILVMLFNCADDRQTPRARLVLCLKLVCGFSTREIADRLFMSPANVQKTLERGRARLAAGWHTSAIRPSSAVGRAQRLETVQQVLYLLFNEGFSLAGEIGLRAELCKEAIRLTQILADHPLGDRSSTWALLALMHLHCARLEARIDGEGRLVPLPEQDRQAWDRGHLWRGRACMIRATQDDCYTRYHGEAAIQMEHALAPDFASTRWQEIVELYEVLERMQPSPVYALNRIIALAEANGPRVALDAFESHEFPAWFRNQHLYHGALGELHRRLEQWASASHHLAEAERLAPSAAEKRFFASRAAECAAQGVGCV